ncbi:hemolysin family protein [Planktothrix mougeotii]|uniref:HlyC/CorC family transporter n=1 Tax=Planktothrix mougeotii LEGE 06226 TaxID=1828728 RepID=A0ABR9UIL9_9CYAN|nr:hemolysin family protein [Planktothrix mougeotii]MBE9146300.1 HlyC/CorC family transporter [Planktothrix mougeotii LEGE 06226]
MSSVFQEILIVVLLILANGVFAMSEMAIVSSRKVRLQQLANQGNKKAKVALELANSPNRFLSTVQVGITLIGILAGAFGGAAISARLETQLKQIPILAPYSNAISFTVVVITITYLSLIIGELVPKRLALNSPELIATTVSIPMRWLSRISSPIVHLLSASTELIVRFLGSHTSTEPEVTEEEIKILIEQGTKSGIVEEAEQNIVGRVFELGDRQVRTLMTPRPEIFWIDIDDSLEENRQSISETSYTRILVCQEDLDHVVGFIKVTDLLTQLLSGQPLDLTANLRRPLFVPETTSVLKILELFKQDETHFALVVDEYGVIQGLVTLNDILMELVGDIPSWENPEEPQKVQREDGSWLLDGMLPVEEFLELFNLEHLLEESEGNYHTVGGFVITHLGRIPTAADHFEWQNLRVEVMDMDGNRVDKVLIVPLSPPENYRASDIQPEAD